jgi:IS5 family transposase
LLLLSQLVVVVVLRVAGPLVTAWDEVLPEQARRLPQELARIDAYLDDERFIAPWRSVFDRRLGRPSVPVATLLRLLYLKHRYGLGYESLCAEVGDSIGWRRFCRIPLDQPVPHPTTLVKLVGRAGPRVLEQLNAALLGKLAETRLLRARKLRIDSGRGRGRHRLPDRRRPAGAGHPQHRGAGAAAQGPRRGLPHPVPGPWSRRRAAHAPAGPDAAATHRAGDG